MARKSAPQIYRYECTLTGAKFKTTKEAKRPGELVSVRGYYELHPEDDDRPESIKKEVAAMAIEELSEEQTEEEMPQDEE